MANSVFDAEINSLFGNERNKDDDNIENDIEQENTATALKTKNRHMFRRFTSERQLEDILDWDFEDGACYHVISMGDIDSLTFLKLVLRQQAVEYCLLSTWCMAAADINELERYLELGRIKRLDCYVGEIFKGTYAKEYLMLCGVMDKYGGRICIFRNHAKVYAGFGDKFDFVIESSANVNTNPRTENTVVTINSELARMYKDFYDGIKSFGRDYDGWIKYELQ